jgi:hypothetical protein
MEERRPTPENAELAASSRLDDALGRISVRPCGGRVSLRTSGPHEYYTLPISDAVQDSGYPFSCDRIYWAEPT